MAEVEAGLAVSCSSPGNCSAGAGYDGRNSSDRNAGFEIDEVNGTWLNAEKAGFAINEVSCAAASSCSAGGSYNDSTGDLQGFVMSRPA